MTGDLTKLRKFVPETGEPTTIKLEPEFWEMLAGIARQRGLRLSTLIQEIDTARGQRSRAAALRLYVGQYYQQLVLTIHSEGALPGFIPKFTRNCSHSEAAAMSDNGV